MRSLVVDGVGCGIERAEGVADQILMADVGKEAGFHAGAVFAADVPEDFRAEVRDAGSGLCGRADGR